MSETPQQPTILVADDEKNLRTLLRARLERDGFEVLTAEDGEQALSLINEHHVDVLISDLRMPRLDGMGILKRLSEMSDSPPVVMITAHGTVDNAVEAIKAGAFDYVTKPFETDELRRILKKAISAAEIADRTEPKVDRHGMVGRSPLMKEVFEVVDRVATSTSTVLITGESGTGKELVATAVHRGGDRKKTPFVRVNCAAIPAELIESELFGYEKGAFTGATHSKPGRFELADGGSIFLDEIGEIPLRVQAKLLRVLQEQDFERVGGVDTKRVDVRVIAATNRKLEKEIADGNFREDLYYRLNVVRIEIPPLRERPEDIPALLSHCLSTIGKAMGKHDLAFTESAASLLTSYHWPGNVRQLENVVERAILFSNDGLVDVDALPKELGLPSEAFGSDDREVATSMAVGLKQQVKAVTNRVEKVLIEKALKQTEGNVTRAAKLLKISRKSLQMKMKEFGLRDR